MFRHGLTDGNRDVLAAVANAAEKSVIGIARHVGKDRTSVQHHLDRLEAAGAISSERVGRKRLYRSAHPAANQRTGATA